MWWFLEPVDVWFFRDGRPFVAGEGHRAVSRILPLPWTVAGALKSAILSMELPKRNLNFRDYRNYRGDGSNPDLESLFKLVGPPGGYGEMTLRGPFAAIRRPDGEVDIYFPPPLDLMKSPEGKFILLRPDREALGKSRLSWRAELNLLWVRTGVPGAVVGDPPGSRLVSGRLLSRWIRARFSSVMPEKDLRDTEELFVREERVGIERRSETRTAAEGKLYSAVFVRPRAEGNERAGLLVEWSLPGGILSERNGLLRLGGEGRAARWEKVEVDGKGLWDECTKKELAENIEKSKKFRLYLVAPTVFEKGWCPDFLGSGLEGEIAIGCRKFRVRLEGAAVGRPEFVGGWDLARGTPKPMWKAVPAGSVYFFSLIDGNPGDVVSYFHRTCNVQTWSPGDWELRKMGFGLTLVGIWQEEDHAF